MACTSLLYNGFSFSLCVWIFLFLLYFVYDFIIIIIIITICWWWRFGALQYAHLIAVVVILSSSKIQSWHVLVPANPDPSGKWPLKRRGGGLRWNYGGGVRMRKCRRERAGDGISSLEWCQLLLIFNDLDPRSKSVKVKGQNRFWIFRSKL